MLAALTADHRGATRLCCLHVPFEETLRRHATKPEATEYGEGAMRGWYRELDLLSGAIERVIPAESSLGDTVQLIMSDTRLASQLADSPR